MSQQSIWPIEPHTVAKHEVLRRYLQAWLPKLRNFRRVVFIDGFAGPGVYQQGEPGSPFVAIDTALDHKADLSGCELVFIFIEEDPERYANLLNLLKERNALKPFPKNFNIQIADGTFEQRMQEILSAVGKDRMAPALVMIDPFGISGVPIELIKEVAKHPRSEFLISLMYEIPFSRFISERAIQKHLPRFFGTNEWEQAVEMKNTAKKDFILDLYTRKIHESGLEYVRSFELRDKGNRTEYYLVFATHSIEGLSAMKDAMWSVDPSGQYIYSDFTANQLTLFNDPDFGALIQAIRKEFCGQEIGIESLQEFVVTATPFRKGHLKSKALVPLFRGDCIEVIRYGDGTKKPIKGKFPDGTKLKFLC